MYKHVAMLKMDNFFHEWMHPYPGLYCAKRNFEPYKTHGYPLKQIQSQLKRKRKTEEEKEKGER